ncbi:OmpA family protein [Candidatus Venteria ishoeyi]|uniref:Peptidoglycan-binding protein ArfA n=1 Tax=Candidatus Venteria ishoeyi TaxID=1899563 RepID=A0A1H6FCA3_9GAMM|nr:OmpA family protein [Candidatus Venteria ishoeyi]SEH07720.1 Peptidoglycan-binding protein ArfA [Candidatus Venteria ishoeyi]
MDTFINTDALLYAVVAKSMLSILLVFAGIVALYVGSRLYQQALDQQASSAEEETGEFASKRLHKDTWMPRGSMIKSREGERFTRLDKDMWVSRGTLVRVIKLDENNRQALKVTGSLVMASSIIWGSLAWLAAPLDIDNMNQSLAKTQEHRIHNALTSIAQKVETTGQDFTQSLATLQTQVASIAQLEKNINQLQAQQTEQVTQHLTQHLGQMDSHWQQQQTGLNDNLNSLKIHLDKQAQALGSEQAALETDIKAAFSAIKSQNQNWQQQNQQQQNTLQQSVTQLANQQQKLASQEAITGLAKSQASLETQLQTLMPETRQQVQQLFEQWQQHSQNQQQQTQAQIQQDQTELQQTVETLSHSLQNVEKQLSENQNQEQIAQIQAGLQTLKQTQDSIATGLNALQTSNATQQHTTQLTGLASQTQQLQTALETMGQSVQKNNTQLQQSLSHWQQNTQQLQQMLGNYQQEISTTQNHSMQQQALLKTMQNDLQQLQQAMQAQIEQNKQTSLSREMMQTQLTALQDSSSKTEPALLAAMTEIREALTRLKAPQANMDAVQAITSKSESVTQATLEAVATDKMLTQLADTEKTDSKKQADTEKQIAQPDNEITQALLATEINKLADGRRYLDLTIAFAPGSSQSVSDQKLLEQLAIALTHSTLKNHLITLQGYTDSHGAAINNLRLSTKRAAFVKEWLIQHTTLDANKIQVEGKGEANPIADNTTAIGRQKNRRIRLVVK